MNTTRVERSTTLVWCLLSICFVACTSTEHTGVGRWAGTIDTLPGGAIAVSNPATPALDSVKGWRLVEELRIGAAEGNGPDVFSDVHDLVVDAQGRLYVLQAQTRTVHVFDSTGRFVRAIGRSGSGPGEFEQPNGIALAADGRLWVADPRNARFTFFDSVGTLAGSHRREIGGYGWLWGGEFLADGRLVEPDVHFREGGASGSALVRFDSALVPRDTLLRRLSSSTNPEDGAFVFRQGTSTTYLQIPFRPATAMTVIDPRGWVWSGHAGEYRLVQRTFDGDTVRIVSRTFEPVPVQAADLADFRESVREFGTVDESRIPKVKPAFSAVVVAPDGHLWVRLERPHSESGSVFDVFDPEGRYLAQVRTPVALARYPSVQLTDEALYGVVRDELDVPQVVRLRVERP